MKSDILLGRGQVVFASTMENCPSEQELGLLSRKELPAEDSTRVEKHLLTCATCYATVLRGPENDTGQQQTGALSAAPLWKTAQEEKTLQWPPGTDLGRYVILEVLGKGGMGVVFRAYDKELDRAVALKVLHDGGEEGSSEGATRLVREAQAMARLSHPNVVAVHDVVVLEKRVCVVMELVEGTTAREWSKAAPKKSWREVVAVYRAAAEGLAAAHDAKLVHRDFKPDNVLVGRDGRTRVTDFGIARLAAEEGPTPSQSTTLSQLSEVALGGGNSLRESVTLQGRVVGTPRYMAPELLDGVPAGERTDQFSFGVALYEALYGQHPFAGNAPNERFAAAKRGELRPPPAGAHVPQWVHRVVTRALASEAAQRFASMRSVSQALGKDPSQTRNRGLAIAGVAAAIGVVVLLSVQSARARAQLCTGSEAKLAGVWDPQLRQRMEAAFLATRLPFAEDTFRLGAAALDRYTTRWAQTHHDACLATRVRGEQSDQLLTLRMTCLQERLAAVSATTELFANADAPLVGKAMQTLDGLPSLATCSDVARLTARLPPPEDPEAAAEVARIRSELGRVRMLNEAGRYPEAEKVALAADEAAAATGHVPLRAETRLWLGTSLMRRSKYDEAEKQLVASLVDALAVGHEEVLARVTVQRALVFTGLRRFDIAMEWTDLAEGANARARDPDVSVAIPHVRGGIEIWRNDFRKASRYFHQSKEILREQAGDVDARTIAPSFNIALSLSSLGQYREAKVRFEETLATARRKLGIKHPLSLYPLWGCGLSAFNLGDYPAAEKFFSELLEVDGESINACAAWVGLGEIAREQRRYDDALVAMDRAEAIAAKLHKAGDPVLVEISALRGFVYLAKGADQQAEDIFDQVLATAKDDGSNVRINTLRGKATVLLRRGQAAKALLLAEQAVKGYSSKTRTYRDLLTAQLVVAQAQQALGRREDARTTAQAVVDAALTEFDEGHIIVGDARRLLSGLEPMNAKASP